jgi:hypothetical protein
MTRSTPGQRISEKVRMGGMRLAEYQRVILASDIDRAIRRAQEKAWDEGLRVGSADYLTIDEIPCNPYRKARKP